MPRDVQPWAFTASRVFSNVQICAGGHHLTFATYARLASGWCGLPRVISEGRYSRCSPHREQVTTIEWKGNSFTPPGTSRWQSLHVTTNCLRGDGPRNM